MQIWNLINVSYDKVFQYIFQCVVLGFLVKYFLMQKWVMVLTAVIVFTICFIPTIVLKVTKIKLPKWVNLMILSYIFLSVFLGDLNEFYSKIKNWDTFLHVISGPLLFILGFIVFIVLNNLQIGRKQIFILSFALFFAISAEIFWEIAEFISDLTLGLNSQSNSLFDTMKDITANTVTSIFMAYFAWRYLRGKRSIVFEKLVDFIVKENKVRK
ncbi:hypothetical protein CPJCM30710_12390 [Clostridium polyendosporum]|uniref:Membrane-spanning protein n=1 Tax=Clostridium polyendosporum TaxID=69208 RepID=A0A919RZP2_9CLOT|nr:hypothetical protein [Clostridium polyendosporum]GIM28573.1 hypothetical protein CPJCM30710_12390 [Clostridium polyendosporum]